MKTIFVSYRRSETEYAAGALCRDLRSYFGGQFVFRDKEDIDAGVSWKQKVLAEIDKQSALLVLIGRNWATATDVEGKRKLDNSDDPVRIEIADGLRDGAAVLPVLLENAEMPRASDLPEDIRALAEINALRLRDSDWKNDFDSIVKTLRHLGFVTQSGEISDRSSSESANVTKPGWSRWAVLASCIAAIGAIVLGVFMSLAHFGQPTGSATRSLPDLSSGIWTLRNAKDNDGKNFSNSVLRFTSQEETSEGLNVRGTFTWRLDDIVVGSEDFSGRYVEKSRQLFLEGNAISPPSQPGLPSVLTTGSYSAVVAPDGRQIKEGHWGSTAQNAAGTPGQWEAFR